MEIDITELTPQELWELVGGIAEEVEGNNEPPNVD
jgi:hypothetical protein